MWRSRTVSRPGRSSRRSAPGRRTQQRAVAALGLGRGVAPSPRGRCRLSRRRGRGGASLGASQSSSPSDPDRGDPVGHRVVDAADQPGAGRPRAATTSSRHSGRAWSRRSARISPASARKPSSSSGSAVVRRRRASRGRGRAVDPGGLPAPRDLDPLAQARAAPPIRSATRSRRRAASSRAPSRPGASTSTLPVWPLIASDSRREDLGVVEAERLAASALRA